MLLNFKISNYRSIGEEVVIDFTIRDSQKLGAFFEVPNHTINNIACLVGPNASGKSNILKGIVYFLRFMNQSYSIPFYRYNGGLTTHFCCNNSPTIFSTEFIDNEIQYKYQISIFDNIVQEEYLKQWDITTKRYSTIFKREIDSVSFGKINKVNKQDLNRLGNDMSLLSLMLELNYFEKNDFLMLKKFYTNVQLGRIHIDDQTEMVDFISHMLQSDNILLDELIDELKAIDTGISSIKLSKKTRKLKHSSGKIVEQVLSTALTDHNIANNNYSLNMIDESSGTLHYIEIFIFLYQLMQNGGLFIADELEQSLHPDLTNRIINRFMDKNKNPNNAQLLFTTHNPWFLQDLTKTQIFITEKNEKAETEITRLDKISGVRNDENYFMKYIAGEYDGCPKIKEI